MRYQYVLEFEQRGGAEQSLRAEIMIEVQRKMKKISVGAVVLESVRS